LSFIVIFFLKTRKHDVQAYTVFAKSATFNRVFLAFRLVVGS